MGQRRTERDRLSPTRSIVVWLGRRVPKLSATAGRKLLEIGDDSRRPWIDRAVDQLTSSDASTSSSRAVTTFTYDANGNLATEKENGPVTVTNTWDDENRRTKLQMVSGGPGDYAYNADGQRVLKTISGAQTRLVWTPSHYLFDALGYYYGTIGTQSDYYIKARWYKPAIARWLNRDPLGFAAGDYNLSRYVGNGVVLLSDPSGLFWQFWSCAVFCDVDHATYSAPRGFA